jgi:hypothetical protein
MIILRRFKTMTDNKKYRVKVFKSSDNENGFVICIYDDKGILRAKYTIDDETIEYLKLADNNIRVNIELENEIKDNQFA